MKQAMKNSTPETITESLARENDELKKELAFERSLTLLYRQNLANLTDTHLRLVVKGQEK